MNTNEDKIGPRHVGVFHHDPEVRQKLIKAISDLGHNVVLEGDDGKEMVRSVLELTEIDLLVTGNRLSSIDGVSALLDISDHRTIPAIVVTAQRSLEMVERALQDHVMAYLVEPIAIEEIKPTIYLVVRRFEQFEDLKQEVADLHGLLETRRHIERAKAVLMRRHDIDEHSAYSKLRRTAMDQRIKIVDTAKNILEKEAETATSVTDDRQEGAR